MEQLVKSGRDGDGEEAVEPLIQLGCDWDGTGAADQPMQWWGDEGVAGVLDGLVERGFLPGLNGKSDGEHSNYRNSSSDYNGQQGKIPHALGLALLLLIFAWPRVDEEVVREG